MTKATLKPNSQFKGGLWKKLTVLAIVVGVVALAYAQFGDAVMGLTQIRTRTFWWVSQLGMLAGTIVFVYAGSRVPALQTLADQSINAVFTPRQSSQIIFALVLLGLFPLIARWGMKLYSRKTNGKNLKKDQTMLAPKS